MKHHEHDACKFCHNSPCTCPKGKKLWMVLPILILVGIGIWYAFGRSDRGNDGSHRAMRNEIMQKDDHEMMEKQGWSKEEMEKMEMTEKSSMTKESSTGMMSETGNSMMMNQAETGSEQRESMKLTGYMNYDETKVKTALASGQKVALFFAASWCPTCRALDATINGNLSLIPEDALIIKVDYDASGDLKKKYGVTVQHTTVRIDNNMNMISKKIGARSISEILE